MNAKKRFDETMTRCNAMVALADTEGGNDDCLRMAIVLAVSAMERYVKDRFRESLAKYCKLHAGSFNEDLIDWLKKAGIDESFWTRKTICPQPRPLKTVRNKVARYLEAIPIQSAESIDNLFLCYDLKNLTTHVARKTKLKKVRTSITWLIARRHAIAHGSDYLISGILNAIDAGTVALRLDRLIRFIAAMDEILASRFATCKKEHHTAKHSSGSDR